MALGPFRLAPACRDPDALTEASLLLYSWHCCQFCSPSGAMQQVRLMRSAAYSRLVLLTVPSCLQEQAAELKALRDGREAAEKELRSARAAHADELQQTRIAHADELQRASTELQQVKAAAAALGDQVGLGFDSRKQPLLVESQVLRGEGIGADTLQRGRETNAAVQQRCHSRCQAERSALHMSRFLSRSRHLTLGVQGGAASISRPVGVPWSPS